MKLTKTLTRIYSASLTAALSSFCLFASSAAHAQSGAAALEDFYRGKTIQMLIGYPAGGTYDLYARVISRHLGKHVPGNPHVVPQNMPGAGTLNATSHVYSVAPQNGAVIAATASSMPFQPMFQKIGVPFRRGYLLYGPQAGSRASAAVTLMRCLVCPSADTVARMPRPPMSVA